MDRGAVRAATKPREIAPSTLDARDPRDDTTGNDGLPVTNLQADVVRQEMPWSTEIAAASALIWRDAPGSSRATNLLKVFLE